MRNFWLCCSLIVTGLWSAIINAGGPEFSADVFIINSKDNTERSVGKIYIGNFRQRKEMPMPAAMKEQQGQTLIQIINPQRQAMWRLFPERHEYWEMLGKIPMEQPPMPGDSNHPCSQGKDKGISCNKLGTETLNKRQVDKWEITFNRDGKSMRSMVWIDPKLSMAIREESPGLGVMELRNIKEEAQPDNLFEVPEGYKKVSPPMPSSASGMPPQGGSGPR